MILLKEGISFSSIPEPNRKLFNLRTKSSVRFKPINRILLKRLISEDEIFNMKTINNASYED